jgi:hypothetical protein
VYLGTVVRVRWTGGSQLRGGRWESTASVTALGGQSSCFSGERLGPMPTGEIGNGGPVAQAASASYASETGEPPWEHARRPAELLVFRWLVSRNWATARPVLRNVPAGLIHLVSLERIVLAVSADELA